MRKGQSSIEFLIILSFSLVAFAGIVFFTNARIGSLNKSVNEQVAEQAVSLVSASAKDVFLQGEGAEMLVSFKVPDGIDASGSGLKDNSIIYKVNNTAFFKSLDFNLEGSLPLKQGFSSVRVFSKGGIVFVSPACVFADKTMLSEKIHQASGFQDSLLLKNNSSSDVFVRVSKTLPFEDIALVFSNSEFDLNSGISQNIDLLFSAKPTASGNYSGKILVTTSNEDCAGSFEIPFIVNVSGTGVLSVFPSKISSNYSKGSFHSMQLSICNNSQETLANVFSERSTGSPGEWFSETAPIEQLPPGCAERTVEFSIPSNASGAYSGFLIFTDNSNLASIDLNINVLEEG